jgi:hypothetical protein
MTVGLAFDYFAKVKADIAIEVEWEEDWRHQYHLLVCDYQYRLIIHNFGQHAWSYCIWKKSRNYKANIHIIGEYTPETKPFLLK